MADETAPAVDVPKPEETLLGEVLYTGDEEQPAEPETDVPPVVSEETLTEEQAPEEKQDDTVDGLTLEQRNAANMVNYLRYLTCEIKSSSDDKLFLDTAYSLLYDDIERKYIDPETVTHIKELLDTIEVYGIIGTNRERITFIYEQRRLESVLQAIQGVVDTVSDTVSALTDLTSSKSKRYLAAAASAMNTVGQISSSIISDNMSYQQDEWFLKDAAKAEVHKSCKSTLTYIKSAEDKYQLNDYILAEEIINDFIERKADTDPQSRMKWFKDNENDYQHFGPYWLEHARSCYDTEDYKGCLDAIEQYETIMTQIFRKDYDYANALPMAIVAAKEVMPPDRYEMTAERYAQAILDNTKNSDLSLLYFAAQTYAGLYADQEDTTDTTYLETAYDIVSKAINDNELADKQRDLNDVYLSEVSKVKPEKGATRQERKEIKE